MPTSLRVWLQTHIAHYSRFPQSFLRCLTMLHTLAAYHVLQAVEMPITGVDKDTLNDIVASYPPPAEAVRLNGIPIGKVPILFHEASIADLAKMLGNFIFNGNVGWPVFYMPLKLADNWAEHDEAKALIEHMQQNGLGVQLTIGGAQTWLRGHWVVLCDMRLRFVQDVTHFDMIALHKGMLLEKAKEKS
jgi:hypothetical protein